MSLVSVVCRVCESAILRSHDKKCTHVPIIASINKCIKGDRRDFPSYVITPDISNHFPGEALHVN